MPFHCDCSRPVLAAVVWMCAAPILPAQAPPALNTSSLNQGPPFRRQAPPQFRYPAAVSGSRLLTSVFGPERPTFVTQRLTHVPDMFGDSFSHGQTLKVTQILADPTNSINAALDLPVAGGAHLLVAENNKALPTDRAYFYYNHFHNALQYNVNQVSPGGTFNQNSTPSLDRFTFGLEKTFRDGLWSAELRIPFAGQNNSFFFPDPGLAPDGITSVTSSEFGNISLILKNALYADDSVVLSAGLGIELPTGDDAQAQVGAFSYNVENDAVHLHPFLAAMGDDGGDWFFHSFLQLDVPTEGNDLQTTGIGTAGSLDDQMLMHLNVGTGYWFFRDPCSSGLTGIAGLLELHYTASLENTDTVAFGPLVPVGANERRVVFSNRRGDYSLLNVTAGVNAEINADTELRFGISAPLLADDDRFFDAELMLQITRRF